jgi:hypothetical protein
MFAVSVLLLATSDLMIVLWLVLTANGALMHMVEWRL